MTRNKKRTQQKKQSKPTSSRQSRPRGSQVSGAPAAVSETIRQYTRFRSGAMGGESLVMDVCVPICQIGAKAASTEDPGAVEAVIPESGDYFQSAQLALTKMDVQVGGTVTSDGYTSPVYDLISSAFVRYRITKCKFSYAPQSTTTTSQRLVFAFAEDAIHPLVWSATVDQTSLLALSDSVPFAPWVPWELDVSHRLKEKNLLYTYEPVDGVSEFQPGSRFSSFGSLGICAATSPATTSEVYGVLYMCTTVELVEFCPITLSRPSSISFVQSRSGTKPRKMIRLGDRPQKRGEGDLVPGRRADPSVEHHEDTPGAGKEEHIVPSRTTVTIQSEDNVTSYRVAEPIISCEGDDFSVILSENQVADLLASSRNWMAQRVKPVAQLRKGPVDEKGMQ